MSLDSVYDYRTSEWHTSHLKVYRRDLYTKIPFEHLIERSWEENGEKKYEYPGPAVDRGMMYPLIELAGLERVKYIR